MLHASATGTHGLRSITGCQEFGFSICGGRCSSQKRSNMVTLLILRWVDRHSQHVFTSFTMVSRGCWWRRCLQCLPWALLKGPRTPTGKRWPALCCGGLWASSACWGPRMPFLLKVCPVTLSPSASLFRCLVPLLVLPAFSLSSPTSSSLFCLPAAWVSFPLSGC